MVPLFATGVVYTGGKFAGCVVDSTTLAKLVEKIVARVIDTGGKFAADVVDTSVKFPPVSLVPVVHLDLRISMRIFHQI